MSAIRVTLFTNGSTSAVPIELGSLTEPREHGLSGLAGDEHRQVQVVMRPNANDVAIYSRENRQESLSLNVVKLHSTIGDAFRWWLLHPRSCPIKVDVKFQQADAEEWLLGCGLQAVKRIDRPSGGLTTIFGYEFVGGAWGAGRLPIFAYSNPALA